MRTSLKIGIVGLFAAITASTQAQSLMVTITADSANGHREWIGTATGNWNADGTIDFSNANWNLTAPGSPSTVLAHINLVELHYDADPIVNLNFSVTAGAVDTLFTISSALLSFPTIVNAEARATAAVTITDSTTETGDTTSFATGQYAGGAIYRADLNGLVPAGTPFGLLVPSFGVPVPLTSPTSSGSTAPASAFLPVGSVSSMSSSFSFLLTAGDQASGTSTFIVRAIPAPGAAALLGLGGLALGRRRR